MLDVAVGNPRAQVRYERLGFTVTPRGRHIGQGTANYCIMFGRDYLELLGFVERDRHAHRLETFLAAREGPMSVAFAPKRDAEATRAALAANGLHPSEPRALGRALELPEGSVTPRFSLLNLPPEETPGLDCFICGHLTPELVRRPEWLAHANGVTGIKAVHLLAAEPLRLGSIYRRLFGSGRVAITDGGIAVDTGRNILSFITPNAFHAAFPGVAIRANFPPPAIAAVELFIASREQLVSHLWHARTTFGERPDGRVDIPAFEANGTALIFSEQ